ncbi:MULTISPECIES: AbrB family transcriptional regulator [unclassified Luteococcus]|uniref:AbrB family transcriptional regulator n=1 Tax=unclassified Luteococcus TaxID=2639923 RepID=UPI00313D33B7
MTRPSRPSVHAWLIVLAATVAASLAFDALRLPSPQLFGALFAAMVYAVCGRGPGIRLPGWGSVSGQALIGVSMGALLNLGTLQELGGNALPIAAVNVATLVLSLVLGRLFARIGRIGSATGTFAMIAGGASGITAVARELGADDRITSVVQYLRVVLILVGMPIVTAAVFQPSPVEAVAPVAATSLATDLAFTLVSGVVGVGVARFIRFPSGSLLFPLFVAAGLSVGGWLGPAQVPDALVGVGYALVGLQVGLRFTRASLQQVGRLLPLAVLFIGIIVLGCAGLGAALAWAIDVPMLDAYLATTPGGLYAVLATAASSGADVTFVLAVQVIRLILVLASAPLLASWFRGHPGRWEAEDD